MKKLFDLRRVGNKPVDIVGGMTFDWQQSAYKGKFIWGGDTIITDYILMEIKI